MLLTSTGNSSSIFENEKLKVGTYKIQNLYTQGYVDIHEHSREMCCRPPQELQEGRGIWEIKPLGAGYMIRRVEPEKPEQFCAPMVGLQDGCAISVSAYPAAWRVEIVNDDIHRGFEYVRLYWGTTTMIWDISGEKKASDTPKVQLWKESKNPNGWWIWKLIPAEEETHSRCHRSHLARSPSLHIAGTRPGSFALAFSIRRLSVMISAQ